MRNSIFTLDPAYSTTRLVSTIEPQIEEYPEAQFQTQLFLPEGEGRQGEGGLRTKGYFKHSYKNKQWYTEGDIDKQLIQNISIPTDKSKELENYTDYISFPLVTVITVVCNGEKYLENTIISVLSQSYNNIEYIIIDGGSSDKTVDIIKKYDNLIDYWISEADKGVYDALNKGLALATGKLIGQIHAGSQYAQAAVENAVKIYLQEPDKDIIAGSAKKHSNPEKFLFRSNRQLLGPSNPSILHEALFFQKNCLLRQGGYDLSFKVSADYNAIAKAFVEQNCLISYTDEIFVEYLEDWGLSGTFKADIWKVNEHFKIQKNYVGLFFAIKNIFKRILMIIKKRTKKILKPFLQI